MVAHSLNNVVIVNNKNEKQAVLNVINKSYTPRESQERMHNIKNKLKTTNFKLKN